MWPVVLVLGSQRSGTTLMGQILGAHPHALLIDEEDGLYQWIEPALAKNIDFWTSSEFPQVCRHAQQKYVNPTLRFQPDGSISSSITHVVLKAPNLTFHYEQVSQLGWNSPVVFMLRDIRDVVASIINLKQVPILRNQLRRLNNMTQVTDEFRKTLLRINHESTDVFTKTALMVKLKMQMADNFEQAGLQVIKVRYEDLVSDPEKTIMQLLTKLGWESCSSCFQHEKVFLGKGPGGTRRARSVDQSSISKWRTSLSESEEEKVWAAVDVYMQHLGYSR